MSQRCVCRTYHLRSFRRAHELANHEVRFGLAGESLSLRHETHDRSAFGPGLLLALRHAEHATGVAEGLEALLPEDDSLPR